MRDPFLPAVHFRGIVLGPSGFAAQGREWLAALEAAGCEPSLEGALLGDVDAPLEPDELALIERCAARRPQPGRLTVHHLPVPHFAPDPHAAHDVLITLFETSDLPAGWAGHLRRADLVLTPSAWNREVFTAAGVPRVAALPQPFADGPFDPQRTPRRRPPRQAGSPVRWLSVFDWSLRKGHDVLLRAFATAFDASEAELLLKVAPRSCFAPGELQEHCERELRRWSRRRPPRVVVDDRVLDRRALAALYAEADAFVSASRGEGWGRPVHEALLMELPVVVPAHTALRELVPDDGAGFPFRADPVAVSAAAATEVPWYRGLHWFEPDAEALAARLREVHADPDAARARARAGRARLRARCDAAVVAAGLRELLVAASGVQPARLR